jgi:hypothetical protein
MRTKPPDVVWGVDWTGRLEPTDDRLEQVAGNGRCVLDLNA